MALEHIGRLDGTDAATQMGAPDAPPREASPSIVSIRKLMIRSHKASEPVTGQ